MTDAIRVGRPDVKPTTPAHTPGTREGNEPGSYRKQVGHGRDGRSDARRSTGIRPKDKNSIIKGAPNLSPP